MLINKLGVLAVVLSTLAACAGEDQPLEELPPEPALVRQELTSPNAFSGVTHGQLADAVLQMLNQMVMVSSLKAVDDCGQQAAVLKAVVDNYQELITEAHARLQDAAVEDWFDTVYRSQAEQIVARLVPVMKTCGREPQMAMVIEALER